MGLLAALMAVAALAFGACGGNGDEAPGTGNGPATVEIPTFPPFSGDRSFEGRALELGIWRGNDIEFEAIEVVRRNFEELTGATVNWRLYTDLNVQIIADLAAGVAPDAFYVDSMRAEFLIDQGVLLPLDRASFNINAFYSGVVDTFSSGGVVYAIPKDQSVLGRYVNTRLLEQAGFTLADVPASAEEYLEFLPRLQAALDAEFGTNAVMAASGMFEASRILHWATRGGAQPILDGRSNWSSPAVVENVEFIMSLFNTGAMRTPAQLGRGWNGEAFGTESVVIMEEGNWVYGFLRNDFPEIEFAVIDLPAYRGQLSTMAFTVGWAINAASPNQDLAAAWLQYKNGPEGMFDWCTGAGPLPTRSDVADRMQPNLSEQMARHVALLPHGMGWSMGRFGPVINDAFDNFAPLMLDGSMSVADALAQVDAQANLEIDFAN